MLLSKDDKGFYGGEPIIKLGGKPPTIEDAMKYFKDNPHVYSEASSFVLPIIVFNKK